MTHQDIEELLGAYALDAVDPDEARLVENHLAECPKCRAEVAEHREVATLLTSGTVNPVPDGVWDRIASELGDIPPPVPIEVALGAPREDAAGGRRSRRPGLLLAGFATAAVLVVIALMGAVLVSQRDDLDRLERELAAAEGDRVAELVEGGAQLVDLHSEDGTAEARALVAHDGDSLLLADGLPALAAGRTYQLWGLPEGRESMVSLGVLGADPGQSEFHVEGDVGTLAVTTEPEGGSTQPSTEALVTGAIA